MDKDMEYRCTCCDKYDCEKKADGSEHICPCCGERIYDDTGYAPSEGEMSTVRELIKKGIVDSDSFD